MSASMPLPDWQMLCFHVSGTKGEPDARYQYLRVPANRILTEADFTAISGQVQALLDWKNQALLDWKKPS